MVFLIKDSSDVHEIRYFEVPDNKSKDSKLKLIEDLKSISNVNWKKINPDQNNDWINQRSSDYLNFIPMEKIYLLKNLLVFKLREIVGFTPLTKKNHLQDH